MTYPGMPGMVWNAGASRYEWAGGADTVSGGVFDAIPASAGDIESGANELDTGADDLVVSGDGRVFDASGNHIGDVDLFTGAAPSLFAGAAPSLFAGAEDLFTGAIDPMVALAASTSGDIETGAFESAGIEMGADTITIDTGAIDADTGRRVVRRVKNTPTNRAAAARLAAVRRNIAVANARNARNRPVQIRRPQPQRNPMPAQNLRERKSPIGLVSNGTVAAGALHVITVRPQVKNWQGYQLVIPKSIAPDWLVVSVTVEQRNAFADSTPQPGEAFSSEDDEPNLDMPVNTNGMDIVVQVQNVSGVAKTFRGQIRGKVVTASTAF